MTSKKSPLKPVRTHAICLIPNDIKDPVMKLVWPLDLLSLKLVVGRKMSELT